MPETKPCSGVVISLSGQSVLCTGTIYVDGEHMTRVALRKAIVARGGSVLAGTRNAGVTLLVVGDLPAGVTDPVTHRSKNLVYVEELREKVKHVCIVDDQGLSALLRGGDANCLKSRAVGPEEVELSLPAASLAGARRVPPRLVPLAVADVPTHESTELELDLSGLDRGTAAHQSTVHLLVEEIWPHVPKGLSAPMVDAAWHSIELGVLVIAEVKSLAGTEQAQQIRLGIGQLVDYAVQLRSSPPPGYESISPVLVLERQPDEPARWKAVASAVGIAVTWPPDFEDLPR